MKKIYTSFIVLLILISTVICANSWMSPPSSSSGGAFAGGTITSSIVPNADGTLDLGSGTYAFRTVYADVFTTTADDGDRVLLLPNNTSRSPGAGEYSIYMDNGVPTFSVNGVAQPVKAWPSTASIDICNDASGNPIACTSAEKGGFTGYNSTPASAGVIGYNGGLRWFDSALRVAVGRDTTDTLTNKTLDANGTGNVLKGYSYIQIPGHAYKVYGSSVTAPSTTATAFLYGLPKFSNSADKANNFVTYMFAVPPDIDTSVDLTATLSIALGGADTGDHAYLVSMCNPAASAAADCTPGNEVALGFTADGSGADGDIEYTAETTLTDWKSNVTAGRMIKVRVSRDGDDGTNDASTVDSYPLVLTIKYGYTN